MPGNKWETDWCAKVNIKECWRHSIQMLTLVTGLHAKLLQITVLTDIGKKLRTIYVEACCFRAFFYIIIVYICFVLEGCCICTGICCCITCIHMHWYDRVSACVVIVYLLYCTEYCIALSVCFIPYFCVHSVCMHNATGAVHYRPCELDLFDLCQETLTQHGSVTLLLYPSAWSVTSSWPVRPKLARDPVSAAVETLQVLSAPAFPHWRAREGMDTLAAYSANTLHRAGKQGRSPPLSIAQSRSSPHSPTMGTAITTWLHKPGRGPAKCS